MAAATLLDNVTEAVYIAENVTPVTWSTMAGVPAPSKVVIETVLAAWAVSAFVSPATGHEMAVVDDAANAVVKVIPRIAPLHATVAAPASVEPPKVQVALPVTAVVRKLVPAKVIALIEADVAGVKATTAVTPVAAATLLDNVTELAAAQAQVAANRNKVKIRRTIQIQQNSQILSAEKQFKAAVSLITSSRAIAG